jgi:hypothetical protein
MFLPLLFFIAKIVLVIAFLFTLNDVDKLKTRVKKLEDTLQGLLNEIPNP